MAGVPGTVTVDGFTASGDKYFAGGIGTALGQVFRRDFPTQSGGAFYQQPIRNRQAQADYSIDLLQLRQTQLTNRKDLNQVEVDVRSGVVALQQARARLDAALRNRTLQQQLFDSEQKRFRLGASTPYNVALQQRDLSTRNRRTSSRDGRVQHRAGHPGPDARNHSGSQSHRLSTKQRAEKSRGLRQFRPPPRHLRPNKFAHSLHRNFGLVMLSRTLYRIS